MADHSQNKKNTILPPKPKVKGKNKQKSRSNRVRNSTSMQDIFTPQTIRLIIGVGIAVILIWLIYWGVSRRSYSGYRVISTGSQEDTISAKYSDLGGEIFRYNAEGASLMDSRLQVIWTDSYEMQNPIIDICDGTVVVADQEGTSMVVYNKKNGRIGSISTSYSIVKVKVARQGVVAAILDGGEDTWINFYSSDGTLIAENQTRVDEPGYPMDLAVSPDGLIIMVAYQFIDGSQTTSYVAFYNFGTAGQSQIDNIVSGYTYEGCVIPQVQYLSGNLSVAFRDDGFALFEGKQIPKESISIEVEEEIISTFYDKKHIGMVFKDNSEEDKLYKLVVYNTSGNKMYERSFNIPYTDIKLSNGYIIMYNSNQACIMDENGREKYNGPIDEGTVKNLIKIGMNRYLLVLDSGTRIIKLV